MNTYKVILKYNIVKRPIHRWPYSKIPLKKKAIEKNVCEPYPPYIDVHLYKGGGVHGKFFQWLFFFKGILLYGHLWSNQNFKTYLPFHKNTLISKVKPLKTGHLYKDE